MRVMQWRTCPHSAVVNGDKPINVRFSTKIGKKICVTRI